MMILNQITDIFWQIATANCKIANGTTGSAWTFKFTKMRSTACSGNALFAENKFMNLGRRQLFFFIASSLGCCLYAWGLSETFANFTKFYTSHKVLLAKFSNCLISKRLLLQIILQGLYCMNIGITMFQFYSRL